MSHSARTAMRIFVTGATGAIGRHAVPQLVAAGHDVTAVGRSPEKRQQLERAGARAVDVDLFDRDAVRQALAGHDTVVNLATHIPSSSTRMMLPWAWRENDRIRREGSQTLVDAALAAGVARYVQESYALMYPDRGDQWIAEDTPVQPVSYNRSTLDAERAAERFAASGGAGVILRFAGLYGPDRLTGEMVDMVRKGWSPLPGPPDAYFSTLMQEDAGSAVVAALGLPSGTYNVADDNPLQRREMVDVVAAALGVKPPKFAPAWMAHLMGSVGALMSRSERISSRKLRDTSGWAPRYRSSREGWPVVIEALGRGQRA